MTPQARLFLGVLCDGAQGHGPRTGDGVPCGDWVFVVDGRVRAEGALVEGSPHGLWRVWDSRGQLRSESEWDRGAPCGRWVTWDADGNLERVDIKGAARSNDDVLVVLGQRANAETLPV
jgi:hypothetical protein